MVRFDRALAAFAPVSDPKPGSIYALILAAGTSSRLGRSKQLLELDGQALVAHVAARALRSTVDHVVVVVGAESEGVKAALTGLPVDIVENPDFQSGQASSLVCGLGAVRAHADAIIVLLGDQPGIDPVVIDRVVSARRRDRAGLAMARYGDERGHPVLFGHEYFDELSLIHGDQGGREVIKRHHQELVLVPATSGTVPMDVDTEEAWQLLQQRWREGAVSRTDDP